MPRTRQRIKFSELRVGIFVLVALLVLGYLVLNSSGDFNPFEKKFALKARFVSADGLHPAADVQLAGVSIGKVVDVKFLPSDTPDGNRIEATLSVSREIQGQPIDEMIRTDSTAQLIATSVLGNEKMINITPGTEKGNAVSENFVLEASTAISMNQLTATGNDLLKQINKLAIPANEILNKANTGEGTLGKVVNDDALYNNLDGAVAETKETMKRLQATIDKINSGQGSAGKLVNDPKLYDSLAKTAASLEAISSDIRAGKGSAGKIVNDDTLYNETRSAVSDLRKITEDFKAITADLRAGKGTLGKLLTDDKVYEDTRTALERFNSTAGRIEAILSDAQAGKGTLGKFITDETLYNSVNQTANNVATFTGEGTQLLKDFRANPKKYLRIKLAIF